MPCLRVSLIQAGDQDPDGEQGASTASTVTTCPARPPGPRGNWQRLAQPAGEALRTARWVHPAGSSWAAAGGAGARARSSRQRRGGRPDAGSMELSQKQAGPASGSPLPAPSRTPKPASAAADGSGKKQGVPSAPTWPGGNARGATWPGRVLRADFGPEVARRERTPKNPS